MKKEKWPKFAGMSGSDKHTLTMKNRSISRKYSIMFYTDKIIVYINYQFSIDVLTHGGPETH